MPEPRRLARLTARPCVGVLFCAAALAGCGGSGGSGGSTAASHHNGTPAAIATPAAAGAVAAAKAWTHALGSRNCGAMNRVSLLPLTPARCKVLATAYPSPLLNRVGGYVRGAVADMVSLSRGVHAAALFVNVHNLGWKFVNMIGTGRPVVGTEPAQEAQGAAMVTKVLPAIRSGSCTGVAADFLADTIKAKPAPGVQAPTAANCFNRSGSGLQKLLREGTGAVAKFGGNARVMFYRVALGNNDEDHFVFIVVVQKDKPVLFSEYPLGVPKGFKFSASKQHGKSD
jgi:hypothetical protein